MGILERFGVMPIKMKPKQRANGKLKTSSTEDWNKENNKEKQDEKGKSKNKKAGN